MTLVIQHEPGEGLGSLADLVPGARILHPYASDPVPRAPGTADLVIVLGGGMGVYDAPRLPHLRDELALLRACLEHGTPVFGICLGAQLLAAALGATVAPMGRKEIGFFPVRSPAGDPVMPGGEQIAFHWHGDAFTLPEGATALASSDVTPVQAFRFGSRFYGFQFHLEVDDRQLRTMLASGGAELADEGIDVSRIVAQAEWELPRIAETARALFRRYLDAIR